jgi:hypothetical protein
MHKLPKKIKPRRSHYASSGIWIKACYEYSTKCGDDAFKYYDRKEKREELKECRRTQARARRKQGTPLSASKALCPIVIPVNIGGGWRPNEAQMAGV